MSGKWEMLGKNSVTENHCWGTEMVQVTPLRRTLASSP